MLPQKWNPKQKHGLEQNPYQKSPVLTKQVKSIESSFCSVLMLLVLLSPRATHSEGRGPTLISQFTGSVYCVCVVFWSLTQTCLVHREPWDSGVWCLAMNTKEGAAHSTATVNRAVLFMWTFIALCVAESLVSSLYKVRAFDWLTDLGPFITVGFPFIGVNSLFLSVFLHGNASAWPKSLHYHKHSFFLCFL